MNPYRRRIPVPLSQRNFFETVRRLRTLAFRGGGTAVAWFACVVGASVLAVILKNLLSPLVCTVVTLLCGLFLEAVIGTVVGFLRAKRIRRLMQSPSRTGAEHHVSTWLAAEVRALAWLRWGTWFVFGAAILHAVARIHGSYVVVMTPVMFGFLVISLLCFAGSAWCRHVGRTAMKKRR